MFLVRVGMSMKAREAGFIYQCSFSFLSNDLALNQSCWMRKERWIQDLFQPSSSHSVHLNLSSLLVMTLWTKVNSHLTLPHPLTVFINLSRKKRDANLKLRCCHLVNLMPQDPDQNCYGSEVTVWPLAYQSCVYLKSMCSNGKQQTEGPQAMEQFGGKSHLGIQIRQVHLGVYSCWNVSLVTLNPGDDDLFCSGIL